MGINDNHSDCTCELCMGSGTYGIVTCDASRGIIHCGRPVYQLKRSPLDAEHAVPAWQFSSRYSIIFHGGQWCWSHSTYAALWEVVPGHECRCQCCLKEQYYECYGCICCQAPSDRPLRGFEQFLETRCGFPMGSTRVSDFLIV